MKSLSVYLSIVLSLALVTGCDMLKSKTETSEAEIEPVMEETAATITSVQDTASSLTIDSQPVIETAADALTAVPAGDVAAEAQTAEYEKPTNESIQQALKNAGLYQGTIDGVLGPKTKQAILDFQTQNSLVVDGKVGPKTWASLSSYLSASQVPAAASDVSN